MLPLVDGNLRTTLPPQSCAVLAVRAVADHPQLLSTSRHVSQGMVDVVAEHWDGGSRVLSGTSRVVGGDDYELRIATYTPAGLWQAATAEVCAEDRQAGVTIDQREEAGLVRATVRSPVSREVRWQVSFQAAMKPEPAPAAASDLQAEAAEPGGPVTLTWRGGGPFYEVRRGETVLAPGQGGTAFTDATAEPGKTYQYAVTSFGVRWPARSRDGGHGQDARHRSGARAAAARRELDKADTAQRQRSVGAKSASAVRRRDCR